MEKLIGRFVTAALKGSNGKDCRQGAVISLDPFIIRGQSNTEYVCEGKPRIVNNPPNTCHGCNLPLGNLCAKCKKAAKKETLQNLATWRTSLRFCKHHK